jgi:Tfp pilus assembly protein PilN
MSLHGFNLLQGSVRPADSWDKINDWVTNVGRVIVMIVEIVVIVSFVARVFIDTQTKNLIEREEVNSQALAALRQREILFRDRQQRFDNYKTIWNASSSYAPLVADINSPLPRGVEDLTISLSGNLITLQGQARSEEVRNFENRLKASGLYSDVQVVELEQVGGTQGGSSNVFSFGIRILLTEDSIAQRQQFAQT